MRAKFLSGLWGIIVLVFADLFVMSRPRFWPYLLGPFVIGAFAASSAVWINPWFWVLFAYFLFPANVLLYGVNDYFDSDTDSYSSKKSGKEFVYDEESWVLFSWVLAFGIGVVLTVVTHWSLGVFLLLAIGYSAEPIRFKKRPFLDSLSNSLYVVPGVFAYLYFGFFPLDWSLVVAACAWSAAMHLYSAVPDISADKKAGLSTTAVVLGSRYSLVLCLLLWLVSVLLSGFWLGLIYVVLCVFVLFRLDLVDRVYWFFPAINLVVGFFLFVWVVI